MYVVCLFLSQNGRDKSKVPHVSLFRTNLQEKEGLEVASAVPELHAVSLPWIFMEKNHPPRGRGIAKVNLPPPP